MVSAAVILQPTIPRPACAVGLLIPITVSEVVTPVKVKVCSAVVFAATLPGERTTV